MKSSNERKWLGIFKEDDSLPMRALKLCVAPFVIMAMLYWQPAKWLSRRAYGGRFGERFSSGAIGLALSVLAAVWASNYLSVGIGLSFLWWVTGAFVAFFVTGGIAWPAAYLVVFKPLWKGVDKFLTLTGKFADKCAKPFYAGLVSIGRKAPMAGFLWENVEALPYKAPDPGSSQSQAPTTPADPASANEPAAPAPKPIKRWAAGALWFVIAIAGAALAATGGFTLYGAILAHIPVVLLSNYVNIVLSALLALTAVAVVGGPIFQIAVAGEAGFAVSTAAAIVGGAAVHYLGLPVVYSPLVFLAAFFYGIPGLITLAQGGLLKAFFKAWGRLLEAVYGDEKNKDFQLFFHNAMNIVVAGIAGWVAFLVAGLVGMPVWLAVIVIAASALYTYVEALRRSVGKSWGTPVMAAVTSLAVGAVTFFAMPAVCHVSPAVASGWSVALVPFTGFVGFPFFYLIARSVGTAIGVNGKGLDGLRTAAVGVWMKMRERVRKLQRAAFDDTTPFSQMSGHVINLIAFALIYWKALPFALGYLHLSFWLLSLAAAFLAINMFMLMGKLFSRWGAETMAIILGVASGLGAAYVAWTASAGNVWATAFVGLTVLNFVGFILSPALYLGIKWATDSWLTSWLAPALNKSFDFLWDLYTGFWKLFDKLYGLFLRILRPVWNFIKRVSGPVFAAIGALLAPIGAAMASIWSAIAGMFGGGKK